MIAKGSAAVKGVEARMHGLVGVFKTLAEQHGEVGALLKRVRGNPEKRAALWPKIRQELLSHEKAELKEVYPVLREYPETRAMADRHQTEASELSALIGRIDTSTTSSDEWGRLFDQLVDMVLRHVDEEENEIFPLAMKTIGADRAKLIEPRFLAAKQQIAASV
jgi:hemerythrin superfamily protein